MATMTEPAYQGCLYFSGLASWVGLPVDQMNFLLGQLAGLAVATLFRLQLRPGRVGPAPRHLVSATTGLCILLFCFGRDTVHVIIQALMTYCVIRLSPTRHVHRLCLLFAMTYLTTVHYRRLGRPQPHLDISGPMMVLTMKLTLLAFNIHDGSAAGVGDDLSRRPSIQRLAVRERPSPLEFIGYAFNFQTVMVGPMVDFQHYRHFIETSLSPSPDSDKVRSDGNGNTVCPSPTPAVIQQLMTAMVTASCMVFFVPKVSHSFFKEEAYYTWPLWRRWCFIYLSGLMGRMKYYTAWSLAGAVCNASGLGFSGVGGDGRQQWNAVSNVHIWRVEMGSSFREVLQAWNVGTGQWLRLVAYERAARHRTVAVYALSALWHGLDPCYFVTFGVGALCTEAGRAGRRCLRPRFQHSDAARVLYNAVGWLATRISIAYLQVPFALLDLSTSLRVYWDIYFVVHALCVAMILFLPTLLPPPKTSPATDKSADQGRVTADQSGRDNEHTLAKARADRGTVNGHVTIGTATINGHVTAGLADGLRKRATNGTGAVINGPVAGDGGEMRHM